MFKQVLLITCALSLQTIARPEPPVPQYGVPFSNNPPISSYGTPNYNVNNDQQSHDHSEPKSYEFGYQVKDDYSGNNYGRQERSDGNQVSGEYRVQLPDGRMQIVTYYADWLTGYHADVRYEGQPQYPNQFNNNNNNNYPQNQYGPPGSGASPNRGLSVGQYNDNAGYNYNAPARSSVAIKDLSGGGRPYDGDNNYNSGYNNGINDGVNFANNYDNFGNRNRPSSTYGAP